MFYNNTRKPKKKRDCHLTLHKWQKTITLGAYTYSMQSTGNVNDFTTYSTYITLKTSMMHTSLNCGYNILLLKLL